MKKRNYKVQLFVKTVSCNFLLMRYFVHTTDALSALDYAKNELFKELKNPIITDIHVNIE